MTPSSRNVVLRFACLVALGTAVAVAQQTTPATPPPGTVPVTSDTPAVAGSSTPGAVRPGQQTAAGSVPATSGTRAKKKHKVHKTAAPSSTPSR